MSASFFRKEILVSFAATTFLLTAQVLFGQDQAATLLRLQRSKLSGEIDATGGMRGNGGDIFSLGAGSASQMATTSYPNSTSCLVVYNDGRYFLEKRDESVGKPKVKSAEGTLGGDELQQLRSILGNEEVKKIGALTALEPPEKAQLLREAESMEVQINREGATQHFVAVKERFKTQAIGTSAVSTAPSTGLDTYLDNAAVYRKTLTPLVKWFEGLEKKSKSSFKDSKPQYCTPMTL